MKRIHYAIAMIAALLCSSTCFSQITITFPSTRAVFQRDNDDKATVYIGGYTDQCMERIEARFVPRAAGQGTPAPVGDGWTTIQTSPEAGMFYGSMEVSGGWYRLQVRGFRDGNYTSVSEVERVGVGEVFVVAGQSNATGGDDNPNGPGAGDDRVNSVNFQNVNPINAYNDVNLPNPVYVKLDADVKTAPFGNYAWCWGAFGDSLVKKINVPVMIFNAGWSGSGVKNWSETINTDALTVSGFGYHFAAGLPFGHLKLALQNYVSQLGVRAILWHQGESENNNDMEASDARTSYRNYLRNVINASRSVADKSKLAWVVSRASWYKVGSNLRAYQPVIDAQNDIIGLNGSTNQVQDVFDGPETDLYTTSIYRTDGIHFSGYGLLFLAELWTKRLTPAFFRNSTPYPAKAPAMVVASVDGNSSYNLNAEQGFTTYKWLEESNWNVVYKKSTSEDWIAPSGLYRLQATDSKGNVVLSPILQVPSFVIPSATAKEISTTAIGGTSFLDVTDQITVANPDQVASIVFPTFPGQTSRLEINGIIYGAGGLSWPTGGVTVPLTPLSLKVDPDESGSSVSIPFAAINNFCIQSSSVALKINLQPSNPLPVSLTKFEGVISEKQVQLKWVTVQETNSDYFVVERSLDAKSWREIGTLSAQEKSTSTVKYELKDGYPVSGLNYYRLKMVDRDGSYAYSDIKVVRFVDGALLALSYPNPVSNELFIESTYLIGAEGFQISDVQGRLLVNESLVTTAVKKSEKRSVNVSSWNEGVYLVTVINKDGSRIQDRVIIRH